MEEIICFDNGAMKSAIAASSDGIWENIANSGERFLLVSDVNRVI